MLLNTYYHLQVHFSYEVRKNLPNLIWRLKTVPVANILQHLHLLVVGRNLTEQLLAPFHGRGLVFVARNQQERRLNGRKSNIRGIGNSHTQRVVAVGVLVQEQIAHKGLRKVGGTGSSGFFGDRVGQGFHSSCLVKH